MADKEARNNISKDKSLEIAISQIEKEFGKGSIMRLGDTGAAMTDVVAISTGSMALDLALGIGGVPAGRIVEIFGPESSGKTTVCLHVIANAQAKGGKCAIIDAEHAIDPGYAKKIGVDIDNLLISQPNCGEDALNICDTLVRTNAIDVLVIDSVAALVPKAEIEGEMGDSHVGLQARLMSQALRKLTGAASRSKTCIIFTNQIREKIGVMFGNPETTPGGNALKFYASIRMDIRKTTVIKDPAGNIIGNRARVKVIKNKMAPPFRVAEFDIMYNEGISKAGSLLDVATDMGILEKRGSWFSLDGEQLGQGRDQTKALIAASPELQQKLMDRINAKIKGGEASAPMELPEESAEPAPAPEA
ncbi:recombinase RecA [Victivallis vadensis]|uniref:Protein RecA n=1 Tax=Victivallis vadensis TaxID=172901 RepID=A0A2U1B233_9BACT|nr:recombinase RecA [Victivallis vadensis]NMD86871.1 recombinase RecA [Victivallis vadensis]PVY42746.1 recombination protein RecA [Victivallis vadensis]PWM73496.1 MAG: recombinase RecA [Lentisphaerota bacterium]HJH03431.1 recombinase RecA [Victivallis vadensis]